MVIFGLIIFGVVMSILHIRGSFDPVHTNIISFSKEYFVSYPIFEEFTLEAGESAIFTGETGFLNLEGQLIIQSSSFSAENPIQVIIEISPPENFDGFDPYVWEIFPEDYFVFLPEAGFYDIGSGIYNYDKSVIILLTKSLKPPIYVGSETIIYPYENEYDFFVIDPTELPQISNMIKGDIELIYTLNDDLGTAMVKKTVIDKKIPIGSSNELNELESKRQDGAYFWIGFTIVAPSSVYAYARLVRIFKKTYHR